MQNAPATFQSMMDTIFRDQLAKANIWMISSSLPLMEDHYKEVEQVLKTLQEHDLYLKPDKCKFHRMEIDFLGMVVGGGQVKMDPVRVEGISKWPTPTLVKELRAFLGFGNFYKDFIDHYSLIM